MNNTLKEMARDLYEKLDLRGGYAMTFIEMALEDAYTSGMAAAVRAQTDNKDE